MGKNKLKVNLNNKSDTNTNTNNIYSLKNHPELGENNPALEMIKLANMSEIKKDELEPIEKYNIENKDDEDDEGMETDEDGDDKMDNDEKTEGKKLTHREKFLLKRKLKGEVVDLKQQRKKCKKTNFQQKKEKKLISKEIHEKVNATLKKKK
ncbi:hypothetical protein DICPUDRAFT_81713 [Dictyostelium purpureum]|uniref:Uncharacterized protein n=1 Tax=Dictyostelium purpureum TaxID=5786 RepID=F0ZUC8_DICPU|nr:uncharacterized protein DICPUDRAFT_81713 [Dictyostelium purpureum]EGC32445.1 hypothetical protein DICPUDRAFT_81713 [Dictyostelium purpureum]|eukprot:XP_003291017.1 hypothetical protein DICPUDRAFT_81713 [Dictyostelium purpureum]